MLTVANGVTAKKKEKKKPACKSANDDTTAKLTPLAETLKPKSARVKKTKKAARPLLVPEAKPERFSPPSRGGFSDCRTGQFDYNLASRVFVHHPSTPWQRSATVQLENITDIWNRIREIEFLRNLDPRLH